MKTTKAHKGEGHRNRLRERFLSSGLSGFHDYEVIELLLTLATPRKDCKSAAKRALKRFKTLQGVLESSSKELCEVEGIGTGCIQPCRRRIQPGFAQTIAEDFL